VPAPGPVRHGQVSIGPGGNIRVVGPGGGIFRISPGSGLGIGRPLGGLSQFAQSGEAVFGTVQSTSSGSFTIKLRGGQTVTVDTTSATRYAGHGSTAGSVTRGSTVLVVGTPKGASIAAAQVVVLPAGASFVPPFAP
jgi:hypothetical protein